MPTPSKFRCKIALIRLSFPTLLCTGFSLCCTTHSFLILAVFRWNVNIFTIFHIFVWLSTAPSISPIGKGSRCNRTHLSTVRVPIELLFYIRPPIRLSTPLCSLCRCCFDSLFVITSSVIAFAGQLNCWNWGFENLLVC